MSRIGIQPIEVPSGVTVELIANEIKVKGSLGELKRSLHPGVTVKHEENQVLVTRRSESKEDRSLMFLQTAILK